VRLKEPSPETAQKLRTPLERLAFTLQEAHRQATSSVFGANFQDRWDRCFSVRDDVAQSYTDQIEATYYQRQVLDHIGSAVSGLIHSSKKLQNYRPAFEECVASLKVTVKFMSDCEPAAVLAPERARLEEEIREAETAFVEFEASAAKLEPIHLLLQRHFEFLRYSIQPTRPREAIYLAADTDERWAINQSHERAMEAHLRSLLALVEVRDECFALISAASIHRYLDQADRLYAQRHPTSKDSTRRLPDDELRLDQLRDELEVTAVMLELESESAS